MTNYDNVTAQSEDPENDGKVHFGSNKFYILFYDCEECIGGRTT